MQYIRKIIQNSRLGETEDRISELEDREAKHTQTELQLEKKLKEVIEALEINSCTSDTEMCNWHNGSTMQLQSLETHPVPGLNTYRIKHLHVCGMSPELQVDFHTGTKEDSDIAFCFRVYFGNCVVMNSRQFGDWKSEEKYEGMPFVDGQPFELCISVLQNEYQIKINGRQCYTFSHRLPPNTVKMIQVWRDVSLTSVSVSSREGCDQNPHCQGDPST